MPCGNISIIFIHLGNSDYLQSSLNLVHETNPDVNIILIGDESNDHFDFVKHYNVADYFNSAKELSSVYQHFSCNPVNFEIFCIQRWFILLDFIKSNNIEIFFYADSDVLIFSNLSDEWLKFVNFSFTLSEGSCGHNSFWNSSDSLKKFCDFIMDVYCGKDKVNYKEIVKFGKDYMLRCNAGGVCDMTFFKFYKKKYPEIVGETAIVIDGSTYDDNFSSNSQGGVQYKTTIFGAKRIHWRSGMPYVKDIQGRFIKFNTLHLQGNKKRYINRAYHRKSIYPWETFAKGVVVDFSRKIGLLNFFIRLKKVFK